VHAIIWRKQLIENNHYKKLGMDPIEIMMVTFQHLPDVIRGFFIGNILKYILRYREKGGLQDLYKARDYIERLLEFEQGESHEQ
jgi:uncharacterized protein DUF3310